MARPIASLLRIKGTLVAMGPLHVGGAEGNADVDLALAVNGSGKLYVPGTSLAGPMRGWLRQQHGENKVHELWGYQDQTDEEDKGIASLVFVEDGLVKLPPNVTVETRDGVGIDRKWGAAAAGVKYNRAVLPAGSKIKLELTVELKERSDATRDSIVAVVQALERGKIRFGAAKTRGLGLVILQDVSVVEQELLTLHGMLGALRREAQELNIRDMVSSHGDDTASLEIRLNWEPRGPLMVKAEHDGVAVDMLPLVSARGSNLSFVLPGSSIKGALRNQGERIIRTVCGFSAPPVENRREDFMRQIEMSAAGHQVSDEDETQPMRLIGALFGARGKGKGTNVTIPDDGPPLSGLGALTVEDCYSRVRFSPQEWEAIEAAPDASGEGEDIDGLNSPLRNALQDAGLTNIQQAFHVAIDRWTGGAADGFLYTVLEPHSVAWEPLQIKLDLSRMQNEELMPVLMCLLLTLRDLVNGRIPLGFATNRGMGSMKVTGIEFTGNNLNGKLNDLKAIRIADSKLTGWTTSLKHELESSWRKWLEQQRKESNDS